jgi:hypothetical protein
LTRPSPCCKDSYEMDSKSAAPFHICEYLTGRGAGSEDRFTALAGKGLCWTIDTDELTGKLLLRNGRVDSTSLAQIVRIECADNDARVPRAGFMCPFGKRAEE